MLANNPSKTQNVTGQPALTMVLAFMLSITSAAASAQAEQAAQTAPADPLFADSAPLAITLTAPFEQIDDELPTKIDTEVRRATNLWLPYIVISEVNTLTEEGDNNKIVVQIKFSTSLDPQTQETISLDASYTAERV